MNATLPPILAQALTCMAPPQSMVHQIVNDEALVEYQRALDSFDWTYQFSDDPNQYRWGKEALAKLHALQTKVDPAGSIWAAHPGAKQHGAPWPKVAA